MIGSLGVVVVQPRTWSADGGRNLDELERLIARSAGVGRGDLLVLPELVGAGMSHERYVVRIGDLARSLGAWIVGGSHHHSTGGRTLNTGVVAGPDGDVVVEYDKVHPYGVDMEANVSSGDRLGAFEIGGRQVLVLVCADFWHSALLHTAPAHPQVIVVPSFSITRLRTPKPARTIWRHMAISRAYEFGAFVVISDWHTSVTYGPRRSAAAAGIAHPYPIDGQRLFSSLGNQHVQRRVLDLTVIDGLRSDRMTHRFLVPERRS